MPAQALAGRIGSIPGRTDRLACKGIPISVSVVTMLNVFKEGAKQNGRDIDILFHDMFTEEERDEMARVLPDHCFLRVRNYPSLKALPVMLGQTYPVRGLINPLRIIKNMSGGGIEDSQWYRLSFSTAYLRGHERVETVEKLIDIVEWQFQEPADEGEENVLTALKKLCARWGGVEYADQLYDAFVTLDNVFEYIHTNARSFKHTLLGCFNEAYHSSVGLCTAEPDGRGRNIFFTSCI